MKFPQAAALASILTCARFASGQECLDSSQECINNMDNSNNSASLSPAGRDQQQGCKAKVSQGECNSNQYFMFQHCATECLRDEKLGSIGYFGANSTHLEQANCKDVEPEPKCEEDAAKGDCRIYPDWMTENCAKTCLSCFEPGTKTFNIGGGQEIPPEHTHNPQMILKILSTIQETTRYMAEEVMTSPDLISVRFDCRNNDKYCAALATDGACIIPENYLELEVHDDTAKLYDFMMLECAPACQVCYELVQTEDDVVIHDCTPDYETSVYGNDDGLHDMFLRIVGELPFGDGTVVPEYEAIVHSRPVKEEDEHRGVQLSALNYQVGPWIITLDNFLDDEECDRLIELGAVEGYERSSLEEESFLPPDQVREEKASEDAYRTSSNSWCREECFRDPVARRVMEKIKNVTGVPETYSEYLQLLKYVPGQYYKEHHDYIDGDEFQNPGPRILTVFLYLNDVEEGGATRFTDIYGDDSAKHIDVQPKKGRALVWPSVLTNDIHQRDDRTYHEALIVTKGLKYGANAWLRLRNFQEDPCDYDAYERIMGTGTDLEEDEE